MTELIELTVGEVAHGGWCVARLGNDPAGHVVFVRHALPGERVRARITGRTARFARADAVDILDASPDRVNPPCPFAGPGRCGGCDWQHAAPEAQRGLKAAVVRQQLRRIAGIEHVVKVEPLPGDDGGLGWRTRITFAVGDDGLAGLRKHRSHEIVPVAECPIAHPAINDLGVPRRRWPGAAAVQAVATTTGERALIVTDRRGPGARRRPGARANRGPGNVSRYDSASPRGDPPALPQAPPAARHAAAGYGNLAEVAADIGAQAGVVVLRSRTPGRFQPIHGRPWLHERAAGRDWRLHPSTFWQVHPGAADALAAAVTGALRPAPGDGVLDLYSGAAFSPVCSRRPSGPPDGSAPWRPASPRSATRGTTCATCRGSGSGAGRSATCLRPAPPTPPEWPGWRSSIRPEPVRAPKFQNGSRGPAQACRCGGSRTCPATRRRSPGTSRSSFGMAGGSTRCGLSTDSP